jgi:hypothetical protein
MADSPAAQAVHSQQAKGLLACHTRRIDIQRHTMFVPSLRRQTQVAWRGAQSPYNICVCSVLEGGDGRPGAPTSHTWCLQLPAQADSCSAMGVASSGSS